MKYYCAAEMDITDPSWVPEYVKNVTAMVERAGGRYLARTSHVEVIEGERQRPQIFLLIEWPSREALFAFYDSPEYAPFRKQRVDGARNQFWLVAGEDVAHLARIAD
ncbi:MAG TPA: DUF1330 domain-containing protein [Thermoanaerobaculia bacterium]|jgi:uncharacterized protein (DUF1330 family)|nr:DUF1330 domain-containing protein [Thermoanaerobaculia bacterium]